MNNSILTDNEKMVNHVLGDNESKTFHMNGQSGKDILHQESVNRFNDAVEAESKRQEQYFTDLEKFSKEVNDKAKTIEIMPIGNYLLVKPFAENPFQRIVKTESGLILDTGGMRPEFKNTDSGEFQEEEQFVKVGVVQEVGPDCRYVRPTDVVMYPDGRALPVPFYKQGLITFNETAVMAVINEHLTERFNEYKEKHG
jgi:hypothetical protein